LVTFLFWGVVSSAALEEDAFVTVGFVMDETALPAGRRMRSGGRGVVATATAVPALPSGKNWPSPACGACTSGATPGRGGRPGMVTFAAISSDSAMVVRVFWSVSSWICCRVYVMYGTECIGIKVVKPWTFDLKKLLICYVKGCMPLHFYL
jgi:hypothetical protein